MSWRTKGIWLVFVLHGTLSMGCAGGRAQSVELQLTSEPVALARLLDSLPVVRADSIESGVEVLEREFDAAGVHHEAIRDPRSDELNIRMWEVETSGRERLAGVVVLHVGEWLDHTQVVVVETLLHEASNAERSVHFIATETLPPALSYTFSNQWWGRLEASLLLSFSELNVSPAEYYVDASEEALVEQGIELGEAPDERILLLDDLFASLPRPEGAEGWQPRGTLMGIGVLFGEALRERDRRLDWALGGEVDATLAALQLEDQPGAYLRPVDYALQAWRSGVEAPFSGYVTLIDERVGSPLPPESEDQ